MRSIKGFYFVSFTILFAIPLPTLAVPIDSCMAEKCVTYFKKWQAKARKDKGLAMSALGELYYQGYGTKKSLSKSIKYFRQASRYQFAYAQYRAGIFYLMEEGFIDNSKGLKYLRRAAKNGHSESAFLLGLIFATGELGIQDVGESDKWLEQALIDQHENAKRYAGYLYNSGQVDGEHYVKVNEIMAKQAAFLAQTEQVKKAGVKPNTQRADNSGQQVDPNDSQDYLAASSLFNQGSQDNKCEKIFSCYHINNEHFWRYVQNNSKSSKQKRY